MKIVSFFSGAGGLDRGFELAKFNVIWANEYDKLIGKTYQRNFPDTKFDSRSISDIPPEDIPKLVGRLAKVGAKQECCEVPTTREDNCFLNTLT